MITVKANIIFEILTIQLHDYIDNKNFLNESSVPQFVASLGKLFQAAIVLGKNEC